MIVNDFECNGPRNENDSVFCEYNVLIETFKQLERRGGFILPAIYIFLHCKYTGKKTSKRSARIMITNSSILYSTDGVESSTQENDGFKIFIFSKSIPVLQLFIREGQCFSRLINKIPVFILFGLLNCLICKHQKHKTKTLLLKGIHAKTSFYNKNFQLKDLYQRKNTHQTVSIFQKKRKLLYRKF